MRSYVTICFLFLFLAHSALLSAQTPAPYKPANRIIMQGPNVQFGWNRISTAVTYELQYAADSLFTSPFTIPGITTDTFTVSNLNTGRYYFWRVRSVPSTGVPGSWSGYYKLGLFNPSSFPNLVYWISADGPLTKDALSRVSEWTDQSSGGNHVTQADPNKQPIYSATALNGKPALIFDGINDYLNGGDVLDPGVNSRTSFVMGTCEGKPGSYFAKSVFAAASFRFGTWYHPSNNLLYLLFGDRQVTVSRGTSTAPELITGIANRTSSALIMRINGISLPPVTGLPNPSVSFNNPFRFLVGGYSNANDTGEQLLHKGKIAEMFFYDQFFSDSINGILEKYLMDKYAPPVNLGPDITYSYGFCDTTISAGDHFSTYLWSGGGTSKTKNVTEPGIYSVTATDAFGRISIDSINVNYPISAYSGSNQICLDSSLVWDTKLPANLYTFVWTGGSTDSFKVVSANGTYSVTITDTAGCQYALPSVTFTTDSFKTKIKLVTGADTSLCSSNSLGLAEGAGLVSSYLWSTSATSPTVPIDTSGMYGVTVTNSNGCQATDTSQVNILGVGPTANFSADNACLGEAIQFTDLSTIPSPNSVAGWLWHFGDGDSSTLQSPTHTYAAPGTYAVSLTAFSNTGCFSSPVVKQVQVYPTINANFIDTVACINASLQFFDLSTAPTGDTINTWFWDFGNTNTANTKNPQTTYTQTGAFTTTLIVTSTRGCADTISRNVNVATSASLPQNFHLWAPEPGINITTNSISFTWHPSVNAARYMLQVASDPGFSNLILNANTVDTTLTTSSIPFQKNTLYWQVIAYNVCNDAAFASAQQFTHFKPDIMPSALKFWIMGDGPLVKNGVNEVSQWTDQSAGQFNVTQSGSGLQPKWIPSVPGINNQPAVRFDGSDYLNGGDILSLGTKGVTVFVIGKMNSVPNTYLSKTILGNVRKRYSIYRQANGDMIWLVDDVSNVYTASATLPRTEYELISTSLDRLTGVIRLYRNSGEVGISSGVQSADLTATHNFLVGASNDASGNNAQWFLDGDIAEIIIYDTLLSATDRALVDKYLYNKYSRPLWLGPDITIDYGFCDSIVLDASERYLSYLWSTGDTTQTLRVNVSGKYWVDVTDVFGQTYSDTVNISLPSVAVPTASNICLGETVPWSAYIGPGYSYLWSNGSTDSAIVISEPGSYYVSIADTNSPACIYASDTFTLVLDSFVITTTLGPDDTLCGGTQLGLATNAQQVTQYQWSTGENTPLINIDTSGSYWVIATSTLGCVASDTIDIYVQGQLATVDFEVDTTGCLGDSIYFINNSVVPPPYNIIGYTWDFDDTSTSTATSPVHYYDTAGLYTVRLSVETNSNCISTATRNITVFARPVANFSYEIGCAGAPFIFRDQSVAQPNDPIATRLWDFGDQSTSTLTNPTHVFDTAGIYVVSLTTTSTTGCATTYTDTIEVYPALVAAIEAENLCFGQVVQFTDASPGSSNVEWFWQFTATDFSTDENPSFTYNQPGAYAVNLTVTNALGCESTVTDTIVITQSPSAAFSVEDGCEGNPVIFNDLTTISGVDSIVFWAWDFGDSNHVSYQQRPGHIYDTAGIYTATLLVTSINGCTAQTSQQVTISGPPEASFSFTPDYGASPLDVEFTNSSTGAIGYIWNFGDGDTTSETDPTHTFLLDGIYNIVLTAYGLGGCEDDTLALIDVSPASLDLAIIDMETQNVDGRIYLTAVIANLGTRNVSSFDVMATIGNGSRIAEHVDTLLESGRLMRYNLKASFLASDVEAESYICLQTSKPNNEEDENPANDKQCTTLENNLKVVPPYPNPAASQLTLDLVAPRSEQVKVIIVSNEGKQVMTAFDGLVQPGLNSFVVNISMLPEGLYILQISYAGDYFTEKFVVDK